MVGDEQGCLFRPALEDLMVSACMHLAKTAVRGGEEARSTPRVKATDLSRWSCCEQSALFSKVACAYPPPAKSPHYVDPKGTSRQAGPICFSPGAL